jgi:UDP-N-acetylmuramyl pentapeptide phosphotransferase/UDP-N-acetylglucosamine-1-phosphate transferase
MIRIAAVILVVAAASLFSPKLSDAAVAALAGLVSGGAMALGVIDDRCKGGRKW